MRVLSLGAGVQSSTLLLMAVTGELVIDRAIFADTQAEPPSVYSYLEYLMPIAERAGVPVDVVSAGSLEADIIKGERSASLPVYTTSGGPLGRQCTRDYKIRPVRRRLQELRNGQPVTQLLGISLDEFKRARTSDVGYITNEFPLLDRRMTRADCLVWLAEHGYQEPPKSACYFCPYRDNAGWREMRDHDPETWARAVDFDARVRESRAAFRGQVFLHRTLKPLDMVDLRSEQDRGQLELFTGECDGNSCMGPD